jgi:hypothetical protein
MANKTLTPQELLDKFLAIKDYSTRPIDLSHPQAKKSAFITIEEKISQLDKFADYWDLKNGEWYKDELEKLNQEKKELEKL